MLVAAFGSTAAGGLAAQIRTPRIEVEIPRISVDPIEIEPFTIAPFDVEPMVIDVGPAISQALEGIPLALEQADDALMSAGIGLEGMVGLEGLNGLRGLQGLRGLDALGNGVRISPRYRELGSRVPREPWAQGDPADSLYRAARAAMNRNSFDTASNLFAQIRQRFPKSAYVSDALYWDAYARYRQGGEDRLRSALDLLEQLQKEFPKGSRGTDATTLATRIRGELARRGDPEAAEAVAAIAGEVAPATPATPALPNMPRPARPPRPPRPPRLSGEADEIPAGCSNDDYEDKVAALNALLQMNSDRALPILKGLLARRDECSVPLRRKAVFLVAQQKSEESADILLQAVKNDPDAEVRKQGVFWLGQVDGERPVQILGDILKTSSDFEMQKRAMFALSQHRSPAAAQIIKDYAGRSDAPIELRKQAIFDIGQQNTAENAAFLRGLYAKLTDPELKERVLFSVSQMRGDGSGKWLLDIAANSNETTELRKKALFWAGNQQENDFSIFSGLYDKMPDREMKRQLIYVFSQRREPEAVDRLMEIAQKETDRDLRKQALFWLGQSRDPRVAKFLEDILTRP
jgi:HEAT repeat protein